jgi:predicted AAA+ superfamily ATPase
LVKAKLGGNRIKEADIVVDKKLEILPIEIKYRNTITDKDNKGLLVFMDRYSLTTGLVITKSLLAKKNNIIYIPLWMIHK